MPAAVVKMGGQWYNEGGGEEPETSRDAKGGWRCDSGNNLAADGGQKELASRVASFQFEEKSEGGYYAAVDCEVPGICVVSSTGAPPLSCSAPLVHHCIFPITVAPASPFAGFS